MKKNLILFSVWLSSLALISCSSGSNSSSTPPPPASSISFNKTSVTVRTGSYTELLLTLNNPQELTESYLNVKLSSANPSEVLVTSTEPYAANQCFLTVNNPYCTVIIEGVSQGVTTISANGDGFSTTPVSVTVDPNAVVNGTLALHTPNNQPLYVTKGSNNKLSVSLDDSTGVSNLQVSISSSNVNIATVSPSICQLSSGKNRTCQVTVTGVATGTVSFTASATGYSTTTPVQANVGTAALPGIIAFSRLGHDGLTESVSQINLPPNPSSTTGLYVNESLSLINSSGVESVIVTPMPQTAGNNMVTFPNNPTVALSSSNSTVTVQAMLWQGYTSGDTYIVESSVSYTTASGVVNQPIPDVTTHFHIVPTIVPATRTITFVNNCAESVWIGVTSSSVKAITSDGTASTYCDPSGATNKCPTGSSCLYAESNPNGTHLYSCFWDAPSNPQNKYKLAIGESVVTYIESTWYDTTADVQWSGNFFGRTKCDPITGICQTGNCQLESNGHGACVVNVGASPQPVTLGEITMQPDTVDSYDVSAIPGVNLSMSFGPNPNSNPTVNGYSCGTAGSAESQGGLNASTWAFATSSFAANSYPAYFTIVESGGASCTPGVATCSGNQVCGMTFASIESGGFNTSCGETLAYVTPNGIATIQPESTMATPPYYNNESWGYQPAPTANNWPLYQLNLCQTNAANCNSGAAGTINTGYGPYTCGGNSNFYTENANTCGCTNWTNIATPTQNCSSNNPAWDTHVKPYISFIKQACPTCYSYPYDDKSSSFSCKVSGSAAQQYVNTTSYIVTYCPANAHL